MAEMKPWDGYMKPFKVWGNLYFVGNQYASTHIIDTGEGYILIDSGYMHTLYQVIHNMNLLGLSPMNIKYILHTHGHIDHMGATKALVELTGAKTAIGEPDREYVNGTLNLTWADELGIVFEGPFEPDILLHDGDEVVLGNTVVRAAANPGHTPGAISYFFDVTDGKEVCRVGLQGGAGLNSMNCRFLDKYGLSHDCRQQFLDAMERLADEKVDIFVGNHVQFSHTFEKLERLYAGDEKAFINDTEWKAYTLECRQDVLRMLAKEAAQ